MAQFVRGPVHALSIDIDSVDRDVLLAALEETRPTLVVVEVTEAAEQSNSRVRH